MLAHSIEGSISPAQGKGAWFDQVRSKWLRWWKNDLVFAQSPTAVNSVLCEMHRHMNLHQTLSASVQRIAPYCTLLITAATALASDPSGDWEFAGSYLGDTNYGRLNL